MYNTVSYTGLDMPYKTLCLTYDDGPGIYTSQIAEFLYHLNIQATFFVVGKYASQHPEILHQLKSLGHLIGNHTFDHPDLTYYQSINGDVQDQVLRTDAAIDNYINGNIVYVRAPYGKWSKEVANELNINVLASLNHFGPIHWDVGGVDCYCWQQGFSVNEAVEKYMLDINEKNHGIIVMHDDIADMDIVKNNNKTLQLTQKLIPLLIENGYSFIRLDEIDSIKLAANKIDKYRFKCSDNKYISLKNKNDNGLILNNNKDNYLSELLIINLGKGKVAIKAASGFYFNINNNEEIVLANGNLIDLNTSFDFIPIRENKYMIRCANGNFFTKENKQGGRLSVKEKYMKGAEIFTISPIDKPYNKKVGFINNIAQIKRTLLYIKSKIKQG